MALEGRTPTSSLRKEFEATRMKRQKERGGKESEETRAEVAANKQAQALENKSESQNPEEEKK